MRDSDTVRVAQYGGIFGQACLVVVDTKYKLDDRGHRGAGLRLKAAIFEQLGIIFRRVLCRDREVIGLADGVIKRLAAAIFTGLCGLCSFASDCEVVI